MAKPPRRSSSLSSPIPGNQPAPTPPPAQAPDSPAPATPKRTTGRRKNASVYLSQGDYLRASTAMTLWGKREGYRGLSDMAAQMLMAEVKRIEDKYNDGHRLDEHNPLDNI